MLRRRVWEPNRAKCIDGSGLVEVWSTHCRVFFHQTKSFHLVALKSLVSTRLIVTCCCSSDSLKPASSVLPFQVYEDLGRRRRWKRLYIYISSNEGGFKFHVHRRFASHIHSWQTYFSCKCWYDRTLVSLRWSFVLRWGAILLLLHRRDGKFPVDDEETLSRHVLSRNTQATLMIGKRS